MHAITAYAILAAVCSTAPTQLPFSRWHRHVSRTHGYAFRYPPCWTVDIPDNDDTTVFMSSPDGSFRIEIQVLGRKEVHQRLLEAQDQQPKHIRCYANGREYAGLEYVTRTAIHRVFAINAPGRTLFVTSEPPFVGVEFEREAARIIASIRIIKIGRDG